MAFGPIWLVRVALVISVAMAFTSVLLAWREVDRVTKAHQIELKSVMAINRAQAAQRHRDSLEMIDRFDQRAKVLSNNLRRVTAELGAAHAELASMRGNSVWLRGEIAERQAKIEMLTQRVLELETMADIAHAEVIAHPRAAGSAANLPTAHELWVDGNHPTVVDLNMLSLPEFTRERKQA